MTKGEPGGHLRGVPHSATRANDDDPPTLDALYRDHADFVWRTIRRLGVDDEAAEDVVQEVFIVVRRRLPDYEGRGSARSWLFAIARGVTANWRRSRDRTERRLRLVPTPTPAGTPEDDLGRVRTARRVRDVLGQLEPKQRLVFELVDIEGMSGREVAEGLRVSVNTVHSRLRLARRRFRKLMEAQLAATPDREAPR